MTREEKIQILEEAQERAFKQIANTDGCAMCTEEFQRLIYCTDQLIWMLRNSDPTPVPMAEVVPDEVQNTPAPAEIVPEEVQPEPVEPEKSESVENDEPQFKMEEVRAALAKARGRGVNVSEIIRSFGADNFQQITKDQYPAIMAKLAEV